MKQTKHLESNIHDMVIFTSCQNIVQLTPQILGQKGMLKVVEREREREKKRKKRERETLCNAEEHAAIIISLTLIVLVLYL